MKKVLFVATVVKTHIMEFHIPYLKMFKEMGWETAVAARNDYENPADCIIPHCDAYFDIPFERSPLKPANLNAYKALKKVIDEGGYDIIHCHTPVGAMLTRLAAVGARKKGTKVIYTAHGFHFFKGAPLLNWLVYYPVERLLSGLTDVLITINREDYDRAQKFSAKKVCYVPGVGIDISRFAPVPEKRSALRDQLGIPQNAAVLLSVGEVNKNKNHQLAIQALARLSDCYYVICGRGPLLESHRELARSLGVEDRLILTGYRTDVADFYQAADIFVFPSRREGLPVAVMEAMASGLPVVCTKIRGSADLVKENVSGLYMDCDDPATAVRAIQYLLDNPGLRHAMGEEGRKAAAQFDLPAILSEVRKIYQDAMK